LAGIVFVLKAGISWRELPREVFGCSGVTCWRRLRDWTEAGVFDAVHKLLLDQLRALDQLDLTSRWWTGRMCGR
jgi:transposase